MDPHWPSADTCVIHASCMNCLFFATFRCMVDVFIRRCFSLKLGASGAAALMALVIKEALPVCSAACSPGFFVDDGADMSMFLGALRKLGVDTCEDVAFSFVIANAVGPEAVGEFCAGSLARFGQFVQRIAEDLNPEGAYAGQRAPPSLNRSAPSHIVGGRLVHRRLEDYQSASSVPIARPVAPARKPSTSSLELQASAVRSQEKLAQRLAEGFKDDTAGPLGPRQASLQRRAGTSRARAIDISYRTLREAGSASPRLNWVFGSNGTLPSDQGIVDAFNAMIIFAVEPRVVLNYGGEVFRLDAEAEGEEVAIGGWRTLGSKKTEDAPWFAVRLIRCNAPWACARGEAFRTIACLELLGAFVGLMVLAPDDLLEAESISTATSTCGTDSQGNSYLFDRLITIKCPLGGLDGVGVSGGEEEGFTARAVDPPASRLRRPTR